MNSRECGLMPNNGLQATRLKPDVMPQFGGANE